MAPLTTLLRRFGRTRTRTVRECRRCGTNVDPDEEQCPSCESTELATYRIEP
jgi:rubrerythrin